MPAASGTDPADVIAAHVAASRRATTFVPAADLARHRRRVRDAGGRVVLSAPVGSGYAVTVEYAPTDPDG
jgi:hypothetical protein